MYEVITVDTKSLKLDEKNPRFVTKNSTNLSQDKILEYLINFEDVVQLAEEINSYGGLVPGERLLVIKEENEYKVLEGNRRTAAMLLLLNKITIPPTISQKYQRKITKLNISHDCKKNITRISVDLVPNREDAIFALTKRHIDGIKKWSQLSQMFFYRKHFEDGKNIAELSQFTGESNAKITGLLKKYSFIRFILDNYNKYLPKSKINSSDIETKLEIDFILARLYPFLRKELSLNFTRKTYALYLPDNSKEKNELLSQILVKTAALHFEEDSNGRKVIDSRNLNKKQDVENFFSYPFNENKKNTAAESIYDLIENYKSYSKEDEGNATEEDDYRNNDNNENGSSGSHQTFDNSNGEQKEENSQQENTNSEEDSYEEQNDEKNTDNGTGKKRTRDVYNSKYLTSAKQFDQFYKSEPKMTRMLREIKNMEIGEFKISNAFLIRTFFESYIHSYVDYHLNSSIPKVKHVAKLRTDRKELKNVIAKVKIHLEEYYEVNTDILQMLEEITGQNSLTSLLNYYVHSSVSMPTKENLIDYWLKIAPIAQVIDMILGGTIKPKNLS